MANILSGLLGRRSYSSAFFVATAKPVAALFALLMVTSGLAASAADAPPNMGLPGQSHVSSSGAFSYQITIAAPPGSANLAPRLTLDYSSQGTDGPEGIGWALSGLPSITRCPRTIAQDGIHGGVNFDMNDRFCLEGQHLVLVSGVYGTDGSEYRTEIEKFTKVIAHGAAGNGPAWFEVHTKTGQIMEFGNTADSAPHTVNAISGVPGSTVRAWAADQISDAKHNYIKIIYNGGTPDAMYGQIYPTEIDYTGNAASTPQLLPYNSIKFLYNTNRPDSVPTYQAGALIQRTVLLTDIKTYAGSTLVYDYQLRYRAGSATTHSRVTSVTLCDGANKCLPTTTFGWQGGTPSLTYQTLTNNEPSGILSLTSPTITAGNFNNDGLTDMGVAAVSCGGGHPTLGEIFFGNQDGTFSQSNMTMTTPSQATCEGGQPNVPVLLELGATTVDVNGDGLDDLFSSEPWASGNAHYLLLNNGNNQFNGAWWQEGGNEYFGGPTYGTATGDFNGDGRADFIVQTASSGGNQNQLFTGAGDGTFTADPAYLAPTAMNALAGDFDGDGCSDLLTQGTVQIASTGLPSHYYPTANQGVTYFCNPAISYLPLNLPPLNFTNGSVTATSFILGDFNGDGKTDILVTELGLNGTLYLSTGTGFVAEPFVVPAIWGDAVHGYQVLTGDFNGDGKMDLLLVSQQVGQPHLIMLSTGTGFVQAATLPRTGITYAYAADWNSDGASDVHILGGTQYNFDYAPELVNSISDGVGRTTNITYDRINRNGTFYTRSTTATYPTQDKDGPMYAVSRLDASNGIGGNFSATYTYGGAKQDLQGRGFLGFSTVSATDLQTGITETTAYRTDFPYIGLVASKMRTHGSVTLTSTTNTFDLVTLTDGIAPRYFVSLKKSVVLSNDLDGTALPTVTTTYTYDCDTNPAPCFGDTTVASVVTAMGSQSVSSVTTKTYADDPVNWYLNRPATSAIHNVWNGLTVTKDYSYQYDPTAGLITQEVTEPDHANTSIWLEVDYQYDTFGNRTQVTTVGCANASNPCTTATRVTQTQFDSLGRFAVQLTVGANTAAPESETWGYSSTFGLATQHIGPNHVETDWSYDTFGRKISETRPDGTQTVFSYAYCATLGGTDATCPANGSYSMVTASMGSDGTTQIAPTMRDYYDNVERPIANDVQGFKGQWIRADLLYNTTGEIGRKNRPYFLLGVTSTCNPSTGPGPYCATYTYDDLGRAVLAVNPDGSQTGYSYDGLYSKVTNDLGQVTQTTKNVLGLAASITDALASGAPDPTHLHTTSYAYDPFGNLIAVTDPFGNMTTTTFDVRARKTGTIDADIGSWRYVYDSFGEVIRQTDGKGQAVTMAYDLFGRMVSRVEPDMTSSWTYGNDITAHNIGMLISMSCTGTSCATFTSGSYTRGYQYDAIGRPTTLTVTLDQAYYTTTSYDPISGKLATVRGFSGFSTTRIYNSYGYLSKLTDTSSGTAYFTAQNRDAELHLIQQKQSGLLATYTSYNPLTGRVVDICAANDTSPCSGNVAHFSYDWDTIGNLEDRQDTMAAGWQTEYFCYDALNRLTSSNTDNNSSDCHGTNSQTVGYDAIGNISIKSGVGNYSYGGIAGPHALTSLTGSISGLNDGGGMYGGVSNPRFVYDANGNMACMTAFSTCGANAAKNMSYTSFNTTSLVTQGTNTVSLSYDPDHQRVREQTAEGTTLYLNDPAADVVSEQFTSNGKVTWRNYLIADGKMIGERSTSPGTTTVLNYFVTDNLGSVAVITNNSGVVLTDGSGAQVGRQFYDAWGRQRNADASTDTMCLLPAASQASRGYTGQEEMADLCLVNLNARIYDPILSRFNSADSMVPDSRDGQSFNRYSYVLNNPLMYTDPTGHGNSMEIVVVTASRTPTFGGLDWDSDFSGVDNNVPPSDATAAPVSQAAPVVSNATPAGLTAPQGTQTTTTKNLNDMAGQSGVGQNSTPSEGAEDTPCPGIICLDADNFDGTKAADRSTKDLSRALIDSLWQQRGDFKLKDDKEAKEKLEDLSKAARDDKGNYVYIRLGGVTTQKGLITRTEVDLGPGALKDALALVHGHFLENGSIMPGPKDYIPNLLKENLANIIVRGDAIGAVTMVHGQFRFVLYYGQFEASDSKLGNVHNDRQNTMSMLRQFQDLYQNAPKPPAKPPN